ncbi:MAG: SET domain-containing protein-lysine N-methyltransferase [Niabella sp.]
MKKQLYLQTISKKGRGVFCNTDIEEDGIIEVCPVIIVPAQDFATIYNTALGDYIFYFNKEENTLSLAMGFGTMYNYRQYPNAVYVLDREKKEMIFTAYQHIPAHTEICINYGGEYGVDYSKWFADRALEML